jgi:hypothetical protein
MDDTSAGEAITDDLVREINQRHLVRTRLVPADLLFVFGTREGVNEFAEAIVKLWRDGFCRHILISGGQPGIMKTPKPMCCGVRSCDLACLKISS